MREITDVVIVVPGNCNPDEEGGAVMLEMRK